MSAKDRVCLLFYLPHVVGHTADIFPRPIREPLLTALAVAQSMIIASRGRRSYTQVELRNIFDHGYRTVFAGLETLRQWSYNVRLALHQSNPQNKKNKCPKTFVPKTT